MMRLRAYSVIWLLFIATNWVKAQYAIKGKITVANTEETIPIAEVYNKQSKLIAKTNKQGEYLIPNLSNGNYDLIIYAFSYKVLERQVQVNGQDIILNFQLEKISQELSAVVVEKEKEKIFNIKRLKPVEGTAIYAGKKSEVILLENTMGNLATNNARQVYAQVVGLNIYESVDAGLQLSVVAGD